MEGENARRGTATASKASARCWREAIKDFFDEPHNVQGSSTNLLKEVTVVPLAAPKTEGSPVAGKTVVFTGTLEKMTRQEAKARAESAGRESVRLGVGQDRYRGGRARARARS